MAIWGIALSNAAFIASAVAFARYAHASLLSSKLQGCITFQSSSFLCFCRLSQVVLGDPKASQLALVLYCINPASVFMSSLYTESLFSALAFSGMLSLHFDHPFSAALCFAAASACRSNGESSHKHQMHLMHDFCVC